MTNKFCEEFAKNLNLKYVRDQYNNVVIFKDASKGFENSKPLILQGHLDIVCQKTDDCDIDFLKDGLEIYRDGDFIKAKGTTLGADNGIAVAFILTVLASNDIAHPPIEAVLTSDEETGLIGAGGLDKSILKSKSMINIDSEEDNVLTVSCAGGQDVVFKIPLKTTKKDGTVITISIGGLLGGHSGVEINNNRVNADTLAGRFLNHIKLTNNFDIININGGDKDNAIPNKCVIELCVFDVDLRFRTKDKSI